MESFILSDKQILNPSKEYFGCNCRVRNECPLDNKCLTPNVVYEAKVSSEINNECNSALLKHHSKRVSGAILEIQT